LHKAYFGINDVNKKESPTGEASPWRVEARDPLGARPIPRIFVICDQKDTAPVWGYILSQRGLIVILETSLEKAIDRFSTETLDLVVIDIDIEHQDPIELYKKFRAVSLAPALLFLPMHNEIQIIEAYAAGVDEVVIKPISPAIFLAKILAWARLSWSVPTDWLSQVTAGKYRLDLARRYVIDPDGLEIRLTNLEFRLLHFLMGSSGHIFSAEEIIQAIWGRYERGDEVLLTNVVYRLRKKIEADPSHPSLLQSWQGGYSFHP
jgi:DNA-binding response OmpR family regulator